MEGTRNEYHIVKQEDYILTEGVHDGILRCPCCGEEIIKLVKSPKFETQIRLGRELDNLDADERFYDRKYSDMQNRLNGIYEEIEMLEDKILEIDQRMDNICQQKISEEQVYQFLLYFDTLYEEMTDLEKKNFLRSFVEWVDIYPEKQPNGQILRYIKFRFPVFFNNKEFDAVRFLKEEEAGAEDVDGWEKEKILETVISLEKKERAK